MELAGLDLPAHHGATHLRQSRHACRRALAFGQCSTRSCSVRLLDERARRHTLSHGVLLLCFVSLPASSSFKFKSALPSMVRNRIAVAVRYQYLLHGRPMS